MRTANDLARSDLGYAARSCFLPFMPRGSATQTPGSGAGRKSSDTRRRCRPIGAGSTIGPENSRRQSRLDRCKRSSFRDYLRLRSDSRGSRARSTDPGGEFQAGRQACAATFRPRVRVAPRMAVDDMFGVQEPIWGLQDIPIMVLEQSCSTQRGPRERRSVRPHPRVYLMVTFIYARCYARKARLIDAPAAPAGAQQRGAQLGASVLPEPPACSAAVAGVLRKPAGDRRRRRDRRPAARGRACAIRRRS
jgi:hypothetical protein